jgi:hypothetical protein
MRAVRTYSSPTSSPIPACGVRLTIPGHRTPACGPPSVRDGAVRRFAKVTNADAPQLSLPTANAAILSQGLVGSRSMRALRGNSSLDEYPISPLLAAIALGGCATPYQSAGAIGGYSDRKIDDQTYHVQFWGNGYTTGDKVHKYFMYRCAELTRQAGFKYFMIIPTTWSGSVAPETGPVSGSGFDQRMMRKITWYYSLSMEAVV